MRIRSSLMLAAGAVLAAGCGGDRENSGALADAPAVPLVNGSGEIIGEVRGGDSDQGAVLAIDARDLPQGVHGMHIHDIGVCEGPSFESAGPHWNPTNAHHGFQDPGGPHAGDLRNVTVGPDGRLQTQVTIPQAFLRTAGRQAGPETRQILDASGAALVIHAQADDYGTDPAGNSGERIACAALGGPAPGAGVLMEGGDNAAANASVNAGGNATANAAEPTAGQQAFENVAANSVTVNMDTSAPGGR